MEDKRYDVVIVGAGLLGCFTARNLSRYQLKVAVLESENDLCMGISRANSAIVYSGADTKPQTLKTRLTVEGNRSFDRLCKDLQVPFIRCGSLMVACGPRAEQVLRKKFEQGILNGVEGLQLLDSDAACKLEPNLDASVTMALYAPSTGTVNPWELCFAAAQNAHINGVGFFFEHKVTAIEKCGTDYILTCSNGALFTTQTVVNCAGLAADSISEMVAPVSFRFKPTRGDYLVLDDTAQGFINHVIFHEPEKKTKGATLVPTIDGNIMVGPSSEQLPHEEASDFPHNYEVFPTTTEGLVFNTGIAKQIFPKLPLDQTIRSFSTMRPNIYWAKSAQDGTVLISDESISTFHIAEAPGNPGFINVAGIKTPGLTCADGIGRHVTELLLAFLGHVEENPGFNPVRNTTVRFSRLFKQANNENDTKELKKERIADSEIVCRCNNVTAAEIRRAIHEPLGAHTIDGIKRRCGTCMGRCQGGFCTEQIICLLSEELGLLPAEILKDRANSTMLCVCQGDGTVLSRVTEGRSDGTKQYRPPDTHLLIIGGGGAGIAAALAANQNGLNPEEILVVERHPYLGGVLQQCLHAGFGIREYDGELNGPEFINPLVSELHERNIPRRLNTSVIRIQPNKEITLADKNGIIDIRVENLIIATGCRERPIGSLPIAGTRPSGIHTAGAAQKMVNVNGWDLGQHFVVLGSGDVGLIMAGRFAALGKEVIAVIEQEAKCGGLYRNKQRYLDAFNIPLLTTSRITHIHGDSRITGVDVEQIGDDGSVWCSQIECDTLITSVGLIPEVDLLRGITAGGEEKLPSWIQLAGNARRVRKFIEEVIEDGTAAGKAAADNVAAACEVTSGAAAAACEVTSGAAAAACEVTSGAAAAGQAVVKNPQ